MATNGQPGQPGKNAEERAGLAGRGPIHSSTSLPRRPDRPGRYPMRVVWTLLLLTALCCGIVILCTSVRTS